MLMSRDEQSCLIVSYRDLKTCIEAAFKYVPASNPRPFHLCTTLTLPPFFSDLARGTSL